VRACGSLNPPSSSLKAIIFWARGLLICKTLINSSEDAILIFVRVDRGDACPTERKNERKEYLTFFI